MTRRMIEMRAQRLTILLAAIAAIALIAGCGGGDSGETATDTPTDTAVLEGTVYATGVTGAQVDEPVGDPVPDCPVTMTRAQTRQQIGQTRTNDQGQYRFEGVTSGDDVEIGARLRDGRRLMTRTRTQDGTCQADVDADTTMVAACRRLMDNAPTADPVEDVPVNDTVGEVCEQYQHQHSFQYGELNGSPPDFSDAEETQQAAEALLDAAASDAVHRAIQNRDRQSCDDAVDMTAARLRHFEDVDMPWNDQVREQIADAMENGWEGSPEDVADAAGKAFGRQIAADHITQARERIRQRHPEFQGEALNALEAAALAVMGDGPDDPIQAENAQQFQQYVNNLVSGD